MKIDRLFLVRNCPECAVIKAALSPEAIGRDDFLGKGGQQLFVLTALSNDAGRELLDRYGLKGNFAPVLMTGEGAVFSDLRLILDHLRQNGMAR